MGVPPSPTTATGCRGFYGIASPPVSFRNDAADWIGTWLVDGAGHWVQQGATPALFLLSNEAPELARIRGIPHGIDLRSPSRHPDILGGDDLLIKVEEIREATGYRLPVSVKLGASRVSDDVKIAVKLVGLGVNAIGYGVAVALALGGEITRTGVRFAPDRNEEERAGAVVNILKANAGVSLDDGALRRQDPPAQHRARGPALDHPGQPPPPASRSRGHGPRSPQIARPRGCGRSNCPGSDLAA